ncbi:hypothetical protein PIB30_069930 [Stylosanthes scabra]|uniref:Uncharacterized protein n=1 Tax=Stylosanthes scabra TaxID=79078 RepID=A0ABU6TN42_9FABA|nr:hypothetical protein [Stylosanthes scabra]
MTEGVVNLPRIMWDVLLNLPYPVFIARLASRYQKGEQPKVRRGRLILPPPAPQAWQAEHHPPSPSPQPTEIPSSSVLHSPEPSLQEVMRYLRRQERLQLNTQSMLRDAFSDMTFRHLLPVTSSEDDSDAES